MSDHKLRCNSSFSVIRHGIFLFNSIENFILSTTIYLWLISLTASKDLSILLLKLYNDGAIGISDSFLDFASVIKTDNQFLIRSVRFMQVESLYVHSCHTTVD